MTILVVPGGQLHVLVVDGARLLLLLLRLWSRLLVGWIRLSMQKRKPLSVLAALLAFQYCNHRPVVRHIPSMSLSLLMVLHLLSGSPNLLQTMVVGLLLILLTTATMFMKSGRSMLEIYMLRKRRIFGLRLGSGTLFTLITTSPFFTAKSSRRRSQSFR
jgi:hypothetical protein